MLKSLPCGHYGSLPSQSMLTLVTFSSYVAPCFFTSLWFSSRFSETKFSSSNILHRPSFSRLDRFQSSTLSSTSFLLGPAYIISARNSPSSFLFFLLGSSYRCLFLKTACALFPGNPNEVIENRGRGGCLHSWKRPKHFRPALPYGASQGQLWVIFLPNAIHC